jgi:hypothetical protein
MGRPSDYTDAIADQICDALMDGQSMRAICAAEDMPNRSTVLRWLASNDDFAAKCARARELQADTIFDDIQDVADTGNAEDVQRAKLRVSTMQWRAAKLAPKKYGDKIVQEHTGANGAALPAIQVQFVAQRGDPAS